MRFEVGDECFPGVPGGMAFSDLDDEGIGPSRCVVGEAIESDDPTDRRGDLCDVHLIEVEPGVGEKTASLLSTLAIVLAGDELGEDPQV